MNPTVLGLSKFDRWYPGQEGLYNQIMQWLEGPERFLGAALPTGYGKSLLGMLAAQTSQRRTVCLTSTKALQTQLMVDFQPIGLVDIRGKNEYTCNRWPKLQADEAPCNDGYHCPDLNTPRCEYYKRLGAARPSRMVVTNYACWMAQENYTRDGLDLVLRGDHGEVLQTVNETSFLICDEAHLAGKSLESFLSFTFTPRDHERIPWEEDWAYDDWQRACVRRLGQLPEERTAIQNRIDLTEPGSDVSQELARGKRYLTALARKLNKISDCRDWVCEYQGTGKDQRVVWTPVWPGRYNNLLFGSVPKVLLMSAMFTKPMMEKLGVHGPWIDSPSPFPARHTPITHIETARIDHRADAEDMARWVERIDEIIEGRLNSKGIIFTVSYERARFLVSRSRYANLMMQHTTKNVAHVVAAFKGAKAPAILVSPSVTTGYDFPEDECSYIIIGKIPYPDTRGAVVKARAAEDQRWTSQLAMETLVQEAGRGTRNATDRCQVLIVDDTWNWFWPKNRDLAPAWFRDRVIPGSLSRVPKHID